MSLGRIPAEFRALVTAHNNAVRAEQQRQKQWHALALAREKERTEILFVGLFPGVVVAMLSTVLYFEAMPVGATLLGGGYGAFMWQLVRPYPPLPSPPPPAPFLARFRERFALTDAALLSDADVRAIWAQERAPVEL